jgi:hypothetical protein
MVFSIFFRSPTACWAIFATSSSTPSLTLENRNFQNCQRSQQRSSLPSQQGSSHFDPCLIWLCIPCFAIQLQPASNYPLTRYGYVAALFFNFKPGLSGRGTSVPSLIPCGPRVSVNMLLSLRRSAYGRLAGVR